MAANKILYPKTMISPKIDESLKMDIRRFKITYKVEKIIVDLPGYYPPSNGDGVPVGADMSIMTYALRELKPR